MTTSPELPSKLAGCAVAFPGGQPSHRGQQDQVGGGGAGAGRGRRSKEPKEKWCNAEVILDTKNYKGQPRTKTFIRNPCSSAKCHGILIADGTPGDPAVVKEISNTHNL